ncbi:hypothetical protein G3I59_15995 [Amycolatopsis rubida]|uniref:Uncharacterized protein n=1 Tax=Amycolatopsis rubida TaxID=112413 RepID=A0ABX0BNU7_9PSEU|nr:MULTISPECIES: hypothetical protein [Amycolatopsis]MYW92060.1 hypothetical protein [Amycolatopsis rubida]NEC57046.1 hypothetical protein [Amycolatopsis rubida]OAP27777.1 hypothetical protein A4R44_01384 [Amycolatopsis sp. M39]
MSSAEADVVGSAFAIEQGLQQLIARGYQFVHPTDGAGEVQAVVGVRVHDNVVDVVRLNAEDDVEATRLPGSEENIFAPASTLWRSRGEASQVLGEVLALPERQPAPVAVASANGCWVPGRGGRSKWLAAR